MSRNTRALYDAVFARILDAFDERYPELSINVERVMSDFERAIQGSVKMAFLGCEPSGCFFHYGQVKLLTLQRWLNILYCVYYNVLIEPF